MIRTILLLLLAGFLAAQDLSGLPTWAQDAARQATSLPPPKDAQAWVLLQRTVIRRSDPGEFKLETQRLVRVLTEEGTREAAFSLHGMGGQASRMKRLKGWNLRPDGVLVKLDKEDVVSQEGSASASRVSGDRTTFAALGKAVPGSLIAFECTHFVRHPMAPSKRQFLMEEDPILHWELRFQREELPQGASVSLQPRNFEPWCKDAQIQAGQSVLVRNVPPLPREELSAPPASMALPHVDLSLLDPGFPRSIEMSTWDGIARFFSSAFAQASESGLGLESLPGTPRELLKELQAWMLKHLVYKQVYLTPERGWIPESSQETLRRRYGDCKDLTGFLIGGLKGRGLEARPALACIGNGRIQADEPPSLLLFDHAITAVPLKQSMGHAAEVETPKGRFLLVDPTDRNTPFGWLDADYAGQRVLICTPSGAQWVEVPAAATLPAKRSIHLEGRIDAWGSLQGTLRWTESGSSGALRSYVREQGPHRLPAYLLERYFDVSPQGSLEVVQVGDPLRIDQPFEVLLNVRHPKAVLAQGTRSTLVPLGLPYPPARIQRPGKPRQMPIQTRGGWQTRFTADLQCDIPLQPEVAEQRLDSPFHAGEWRASSAPRGSGSALQLSFTLAGKATWFGFTEKEKGLAEAKKDRAALTRLLEECLSFR